MSKKDVTRDNHYVPIWQQKGFIPNGKTKLYYLNMAPGEIHLSGPGLHEMATRHFIERGRYELSDAALPGTHEHALFEAAGGTAFGTYDGPTSEGSPVLNGLRYIASYGDLADAFGADADAGLAHFEAHGADEERVIRFNPQQYMDRLPNVRAYYEAQGFSGEALEIKATEHFINHGRHTLAGPGQPAAPAGGLAPGAGTTGGETGVALPSDEHADILATAQGGPIDLSTAYAPETELDGLRYIAMVPSPLRRTRCGSFCGCDCSCLTYLRSGCDGQPDVSTCAAPVFRGMGWSKDAVQPRADEVSP